MHPPPRVEVVADDDDESVASDIQVTTSVTGAGDAPTMDELIAENEHMKNNLREQEKRFQEVVAARDEAMAAFEEIETTFEHAREEWQEKMDALRAQLDVEKTAKGKALEVREAEIAALKIEIARLTHQNTDLTLEKGDTERDLEEVQAECEKTAAENTRLEAEIERLTRENALLRGEDAEVINIEKDKRIAEQASAIKKLEGVIATYKTSDESWEGQVAELEEHVKRLEIEKEGLENDIKQRMEEFWQGKLEYVNFTLRERTDRLSHVERDYYMLTEKMAQIEEWKMLMQRELSYSNQTYQDLQAQLDQMQNAQKLPPIPMEGVIMHNRKLKRDLVELKRRFTQEKLDILLLVEGEMEKSLRLEQQLSSETMRLKDEAATERKDYEQKILQYTEEIQTLKGGYSALITTNAELDAQCTLLGEKNEEKAQTIKFLKTKIQILEKGGDMNAVMESTIAKLRDRVESLLHSMYKLEVNLKETTMQKRIVSHNALRTTQALAFEQQRVERARVRMNTLQTKYDKLEQEISLANVMNDSLQKQVRDLIESGGADGDISDDDEADVEALQELLTVEKNNALQQKVILEAEAQKSRQMIAQVQQEKYAVEANLAQLQTDNSTLTAERNTLTQRVTALEGDVARLEQVNAAARAEIERLKGLLKIYGIPADYDPTDRNKDPKGLIAKSDDNKALLTYMCMNWKAACPTPPAHDDFTKELEEWGLPDDHQLFHVVEEHKVDLVNLYDTDTYKLKESVTSMFKYDGRTDFFQDHNGMVKHIPLAVFLASLDFMFDNDSCVAVFSVARQLNDAKYEFMNRKNEYLQLYNRKCNFIAQLNRSRGRKIDIFKDLELEPDLLDQLFMKQCVSWYRELLQEYHGTMSTSRTIKSVQQRVCMEYDFVCREYDNLIGSVARAVEVEDWSELIGLDKTMYKHFDTLDDTKQRSSNKRSRIGGKDMNENLEAANAVRGLFLTVCERAAMSTDANSQIVACPNTQMAMLNKATREAIMSLQFLLNCSKRMTVVLRFRYDNASIAPQPCNPIKCYFKFS